jgi:soluble lytic murein transglycosylase-like protein
MSTTILGSSLQPAASTKRRGCLPFRLLVPSMGVLFSILIISLAISLTSISAGARAASVEETRNFANTAQSISPVFTLEVQHWSKSIQQWANSAGLDPNLAATVMQIESCGNPEALSRSGAIGLFQVMPYHFSSTDNPYLPDTNALRGLDYLRRSLETAGGDPRLALAGYNGGIGVVGRAEASWPEQTQNYARWGGGIYADATAGMQESPHLLEWLNANGIWLCRQARDRLGID